jgi:DNA-binding YbaB/EbfC family protein
MNTQAMQRDMTKKKEELNAMEFEGNSSIVKVKVNGKKEILSVKINDKESFEKDDLEMLEDMLVVAVNDAFSKVDTETKKKMGNLGGLGDLL